MKVEHNVAKVCCEVEGVRRVLRRSVVMARASEVEVDRQVSCEDGFGMDHHLVTPASLLS